MDLIAMRVALVKRVVDGTDRAVQGYPYPKGNEQLPCVVVHTADEYVDPYGTIAAMGGMAVVNLVLVLMAPCRVAYEDGMRVLDEMMSAGIDLPNSVADAIEADRTLGGVVDDVLLGVSSGHTGINPDEQGRPQAVICRWPLTVYAQRS